MVNLTPEQEELLQQEAFDQGTKVAQIFSGIFFVGLAGWLVVTNGTSLAFVQRAALEKRLTVCCFLNIYVGFFSAFFNIFQLTDVDDAILPTQKQFTLDLSRPIEWVLTCPIMQLSLVLMGGAKIPEYRRYLMPAFSVFILSCGTASTFMPILGLKLACYLVGVLGFCTMVYFNRLQILEYSAGNEGLFTGDSEFRKATVLLITTWAPFPMWFLLSPEGFDIINNVLLIQVGWAFLNIVSKFTLIFYIQRIKDLYCNRLKTRRELVGHRGSVHAAQHHRHGSTSPPDFDFKGALPDYETAQEFEEAERERKREKLGAVVVETMTFLGMAQHTDRFLALLSRAEIETVSEVEALSKEQGETLQLPWDLVTAVQRRLRVWKLEMVDDAEAGLERGEEHYIKKGLEMPKMDPMEAVLHQQPLAMPHMVPYGSFLPPHAASTPGLDPCNYTGGLASPAAYDLPLLPAANLEELLLKTEEKILDGHKSGVQSWEKALEAVASNLREVVCAMEKRMTRHIHQQLEGTAKTSEQRGELRAFETRLNVKLDELAKSAEQRHEVHALEKRLHQKMEQHLSILSTKIDVCCEKVEACGQKVENCGQKVDSCGLKADACTQRVDACAQKVDACNRNVAECSAAMVGLQGEGVAKLLGKVEELSGQSRSNVEVLLQRAEALQLSQVKLASESENGWRDKLNELENSMVCRDDEQEANQKRRFDELVRLSVGKRLDEVLAQVQRAGDRGEAAVEGLRTSLQAELHTAVGRVNAKSEGLHAGSQRQAADSERAMQQRLDEAVVQAVAQAAQQAALGARETAQRAEKAVEALDSSLQQRLGEAVAQAAAQVAQQGAAQAAQRAERAVESLEGGLQKRLEDAMAKALAEGSHQAVAHMAQRTEKAIESLEGAQRAGLQSAMTNVVERVDDIQATQLRKVGEREERNMRRMEELLELTTNRSLQKVEDIGLELKKEIHGFAKRLNSKIPFM